MFKKLVKKLREQEKERSCSYMSSPFCMGEDDRLKNLSEHALTLYEKKSDVKKFTKLAMSDPDNDDYKQIMDDLFSNKRILDPLEESYVVEMVGNDNFLKDLGL